MKVLFAPAVALALVGLPVAAQTQAPGARPPGVTFRSQRGEIENAMAERQKQLAAMPPDQRRVMPQLMAGRGPSSEGEVTFASDKACTGKAVLTTVQGRPEKMNIGPVARWISADCDGVQ